MRIWCDCPPFDIVQKMELFGFYKPMDVAWHELVSDTNELLRPCHGQNDLLLALHQIKGEDGNPYRLRIAQCGVCHTIYWREENGAASS